MKDAFYSELADRAMNGRQIDDAACRSVLSSPDIDLMNLLHSAYRVRKHYWGNAVTIHIIDNVQNGSCSQDCRYCAQSKSSNAPIRPYPFKSDDEILLEARQAFEAGAFRHCLVFSGYGPSSERIKHLVKIIREIKRRYHPMQVCVSPGVINDEQARILKDAGLDRLNHNLNTSEPHYSKICSTHTFRDRLQTIKAARHAGLEICSGIIVGLGEGPDDIISVARLLRENSAASIPVNFLIPIEGIDLPEPKNLTPEYCLRVLCLFRFINPKAEIRMAAGREIHLRSLEVLGLYPANSLFLEGYLNAKGSSRVKTLRMIKDAGFTIKSEKSLDELLENEKLTFDNTPQDSPIALKSLADLHPGVMAEKKG